MYKTEQLFVKSISIQVSLSVFTNGWIKTMRRNKWAKNSGESVTEPKNHLSKSRLKFVTHVKTDGYRPDVHRDRCISDAMSPRQRLLNARSIGTIVGLVDWAWMHSTTWRCYNTYYSICPRHGERRDVIGSWFVAIQSIQINNNEVCL